MDVPGELDLLGGEVAAGVVGQLLAEDEDGVERRAQLVRHVGQELGLVLGGQRQLGGLLLEGAAGLLDFLVLALDLDVLLGELAGLGGQLLVGLLQFLLLRLQFDGELLRLLEQALGAHGGLDRVEHHADGLRELFQERQVGRREGAQRGQLDHGLGLALEQRREHDDVARLGLAQAGMDLRVVGRHIGEQNALLLDRALADQPFAQRDALGLVAPLRVAGQQAQGRLRRRRLPSGRWRPAGR